MKNVLEWLEVSESVHPDKVVYPHQPIILIPMCLKSGLTL